MDSHRTDETQGALMCSPINNEDFLRFLNCVLETYELNVGTIKCMVKLDHKNMES